MNSIMLCAVIGFAVGLIIASCGKRESAKYIISTVTGTIVGAVVGLCVASIICYLVPMKNVIYGPVKLAAVRSFASSSGTFIWGAGSIECATYNFLELMEDGSLAPDSVPADRLVRLIEDPELLNIGFLSITMSETDKTSPLYPWAIGTRDRTRIVRKEFRVPVGTVVQQFNIK